ncbi:RICIN domain-containing protein [Pedobacter aquatilis]|uniref:RICIN domain-containing protein n=1 Tax=Pedobacter aquatilis TaxID=351343 RepID=UPI00292FA771|nr:RICIN domain-containing protein [Pedobacter aquatilis]
MKGFNRKRSYLLLLFLLVFTTMGIAQEISGNYAIKNLETGLLLRVKDANSKNGTPLVAYEPQNWKCMTWDFISAGDNVYQLKNLFTGKTFQQKAGSDGSTLEEQPLEKGKEAQLYTFEAVGENIYRIKLKGSTLYLTNNKAEVNAPIVLKPKTTDKNQLWQIYQQSPTM